MGGEYNFPWHFIDRAYLDKGGSEKDYPDFQYDHHNITEAIPDLISWLRKDDGFQFTHTYKTIMKHLTADFTIEEG